MDTVMLILRLLHVGGGVVWAGAAFLLVLVVEPAVAASGPDGGKVMQRMAGAGGIGLYMFISSMVTMLAGVLLYWRISNGFAAGWVTSGTGIVFGLGGLAALISSILGVTVSNSASARMGQIGKEMQGAGGPPRPELLAEMGVLQQRLQMSSRLSALLLGFAVLTMATARYL